MEITGLSLRHRHRHHHHQQQHQQHQQRALISHNDHEVNAFAGGVQRHTTTREPSAETHNRRNITLQGISVISVQGADFYRAAWNAVAV